MGCSSCGFPPTPFVWTKVEAAAYLRDGTLPENFEERLGLVLDPLYPCSNCDGRLCMGCVFREYDHDCAHDCPYCCENGVCVEAPYTEVG